MTLMPLDDGYFAASLLLEIPGIPHTLILKFLRRILGFGLPIGLVQTVAFLSGRIDNAVLEKGQKGSLGIYCDQTGGNQRLCLVQFLP